MKLKISPEEDNTCTVTTELCSYYLELIDESTAILYAPGLKESFDISFFPDGTSQWAIAAYCVAEWETKVYGET